MALTPPCWLNGALLPPAAARIDPADRGFLLGDGVFETVAVRAAAPAHLSRHLARLAVGATTLRLACPHDSAAIATAAALVIAAAGKPDGSIRITLSRGPAPRGLLPPAAPSATLLIAWSDPAEPRDRVRAIVSASTCRNERSPLARIKSLNYLESVLARLEAAERGAQEAILLNTAGRVADATAANLFAVIGGDLLTPPITDGALPGIARALLLERAGARQATLLPEDLRRCESLFLTNSLGISEIAQLDDASFPPAPHRTAQLRAAVAWPHP